MWLERCAALWCVELGANALLVKELQRRDELLLDNEQKELEISRVVGSVSKLHQSRRRSK